MKLKNKSQLMVFVILGIVILSLLSFLVYFQTSSLAKKTEQETIKVQKATLNVQAVKNYIQTCLDKVAKESLELIGKQGGYIYISQGGTLSDYRGALDPNEPSDEGKFFVRRSNIIVSYSIYPPRYSLGNYHSEIPLYPWLYFPYPDPSDTSTLSFEGYFGLTGLPPLLKEEGAHSIQLQIEGYVSHNIKNCLDFSVFKEQGIEIKEKTQPSQPIVKAVLGDNDVAVQLEHSLIIEHASTDETRTLEEFTTNIPVRIKYVYKVLKGLVEKDISDISFNLETANFLDTSLSLAVTKDINILNTPSQDDLVIVTDSKSTIKGNAFQFQTARHNRNPALYYNSPSSTSFSVGDIVDRADIFPVEQASDPDEDTLTFTYDTTFPYTFTTGDRTIGKKTFTLTASDGSLTDYQEIEVQVS